MRSLIFAFEQNNTKALSNQTLQQYNQVISQCRSIFLAKNRDYGLSWRIMRVSSLTDQIYIKATRIRNIEENGTKKVDEGVEPEFMGIINYCIMALIQLNPSYGIAEPTQETLQAWYDEQTTLVRDLMLQKNHDYGEIWRDMMVSTFTDMLLMRVHRIRQILENKGLTTVSEGVDSNFMDMINYSVFALIKLSEKNNPQ